MNLDGINFTLLSRMSLAEEIAAVLPTPQAGRAVLVFGQGPHRYERLDVAGGERSPLPLPSESALVALDDSGRYYLLGDESKTLVRYTSDCEEDLRITLRGQRELSIGQDGNIYTWLFSSREVEVYDSAGRLLRVLTHMWAPYSLAVDDKGVIWLGEAADSHVIEISPTTGETVGYIDPKEDFAAENLFCYTYAMNFDRSGNLWTFNGQGDVGMTIINPDKTNYIRFASKDLGPEYRQSQPVPSAWHDEVYLVSERGDLTVYSAALLNWKDITPDIHNQG